MAKKPSVEMGRIHPDLPSLSTSVYPCLCPYLCVCVSVSARAASGSSVHLRMIRDSEGYAVVEATLTRQQFDEDQTILTMKGGTKACGIGVVLDVDSRTGLFFIKRVVEGGSAWLAGACRSQPLPPLPLL